MYGATVGLEIGKRALLAQQLSLNITGHNIANVNTPGYTRQQAILSSNLPLTMPFGSVGTGVEISNIRRIRSLFLDQQMRGETQKMGKWSLLSESWSQVESIFSEPEDTGFSAVLDQFWNSWQDLANNPQSEAARIAVREQGTLLVNSFHHISSQMDDLKTSLDSDITKMTEEINNIAGQIANVNQSISTSELSGNPANDLRDRRDYLVDLLSEYVDVSVIEQSSGSMTVLLGSMALVEGNSHIDLATKVEGKSNSYLHTVLFKGTGIELKNAGGRLDGLIEMRDKNIAGKQAELDNLARELVKAVNGVHSSGYGARGSTGVNFFDAATSGAADIDLDFLITQDVNYIAAGTTSESGNNANALNIAALRNSLRVDGAQATFNDYYNSIIGEVGIKSREANVLLKNQQALVTQIDNSRQSLEGVSLDEEMANMIEQQHAYSAAAKVITAMDEALDTIINRMGA
jgi:flagellar hook-associated protein 1